MLYSNHFCSSFITSLSREFVCGPATDPSAGQTGRTHRTHQLIVHGVTLVANQQPVHIIISCDNLILSSEFMCSVPVDYNPKPLPLHWAFSLLCYFLCQNAMSYTLKQVFVRKLRRRLWHKLQDITLPDKKITIYTV